MAFLALLAGLVAAVAGWRAWRRLRFFLHLFQLEGYKPRAYGAWLRAHATPLVVAPSHGLGLGLVVLAAVGTTWLAGLALFGWLLAFASDAAWAPTREKKPLAWTARMRRLATAALLLAALPVVAGLGLGAGLGTGTATALYLLGWLLADLGAPAWVRLAALAMEPVEAHLRERFKRAARAKLARQTDLTVVGITGSYGKTSTKFVVAEVLRQRFHTLASPGSYNTPMGLCIVINEQLRPEHRVLVLEYGIRHPGDMDELTALVRPDVAVLTTIGVAHLETMGSVEAIAREKAKLPEAVRPGGTVVLNADDPRVAAVAERLAEGVRVLRVSARGDAAADLVASEVHYGPEGASFTVRDREGEAVTLRTRLLGEHNVLNVLLGLAVGRAMGLRLRQMAPAVERLQPVPHRLELKREGGVLVIDDAFNANPVGARNAVALLGRFEAHRRVIVTPGMVELGERQAEENRALGRHIASVLTREGDLAVLVGPRQTAPIREGLLEGGFPEERICVVRSLFEARDLLRPLLRDGDVVLYENDLPDQYDER